MSQPFGRSSCVYGMRVCPRQAHRSSNFDARLEAQVGWSHETSVSRRRQCARSSARKPALLPQSRAPRDSRPRTVPSMSSVTRVFWAVGQGIEPLPAPNVVGPASAPRRDPGGGSGACSADHTFASAAPTSTRGRRYGEQRGREGQHGAGPILWFSEKPSERRYGGARRRTPECEQ